MKRFVYQFEKLLEYRSHLEKEEQNVFSKVLGEYVAIENVIKDAISERSRILLDSKSFLESNNLSLLYHRDNARKALKVRMGKYQEKLKEKEIPLKKAREKLVEARKKKKTLEILKEKAWVKYKKEVEIEEQFELDDFGITAYFRKANQV